MIAAAGGFRLEAVKLTSSDALGTFSASLLTGEASTGTLVTRLQAAVMTASSVAGVRQAPNSNQRVDVYLYSTTGPTYYLYGSFNLTNDFDAVQWADSPVDLVLPDNTWAFRFRLMQAVLPANCELVLKAWGQDIA